MRENEGISITTCSFDEVLPVWQGQLWPGRNSIIEPTSAIDPQGAIDMRWKNDVIAQFWKLSAGANTIGVASALALPQESVRVRGFWLDPAHRSQGLGTKLMTTVLDWALGQPGVSFLWTMSRRDASRFYVRSGFRVVREVEGYEFGPHLLMKRDL